MFLLSDEDPDVHVCGRCKATFIDLSEYVRHKRNKPCRRGLEEVTSSPAKELPVKEIVVHVDEEKIQGIKIGSVHVTEMLKSPLSRALPSGPLGPPAKGDSSAMSQEVSTPPVTIDVGRDKTMTENPRPFTSLLQQRHTITSAQIKPLGEKVSMQKQNSSSESDNEEYREATAIMDHPHITEHGPTVVILDGTELESAQIVPSQKVEVQLIDDERLSPEFGGPLVEVSHDHGYSRPSSPAVTGIALLNVLCKFSVRKFSKQYCDKSNSKFPIVKEKHILRTN